MAKNGINNGKYLKKLTAFLERKRVATMDEL